MRTRAEAVPEHKAFQSARLQCDATRQSINTLDIKPANFWERLKIGYRARQMERNPKKYAVPFRPHQG
jgi:hypothetical protein